MKLSLEMVFHTDGDFNFNAIEKLLDPKSSFYKGAVKGFRVINEPDYEYISIALLCEGDDNGCRWAARDVMENLVAGGIRVVHYWLVKHLYDLIITPKETVLWSDKDVHYYDTISGNYDGTFLALDIVH